jgi:hypothetical protein
MNGKTRRIYGFAGLVILITCLSGSANAQVSISPVAIGGYGNYGGGTVDGNYFWGASQVIRAEGEYNALSAQAAVSYEEARTKYLENRNKWIQTYFASREANQAYKAQWLAQTRHSRETLAQVAASGVPRPLAVSEFDSATGKINWPGVLREKDYASQRAELGRLFEGRAQARDTQTGVARIHENTRQMASVLRSNIARIPANDYMAARKFLERLDYSVVATSRASVQPAPDAVGD